MLTDDEIRAALRPLYADEAAMEMAPMMGIPEARAIERAVLAAQPTTADALDATRYRWLRDTAWNSETHESVWWSLERCPSKSADLDEAIDAAMAREPAVVGGAR